MEETIYLNSLLLEIANNQNFDGVFEWTRPFKYRTLSDLFLNDSDKQLTFKIVRIIDEYTQELMDTIIEGTRRFDGNYSKVFTALINTKGLLFFGKELLDHLFDIDYDWIYDEEPMDKEFQDKVHDLRKRINFIIKDRFTEEGRVIWKQ